LSDDEQPILPVNFDSSVAVAIVGVAATRLSTNSLTFAIQETGVDDVISLVSAMLKMIVDKGVPTAEDEVADGD
jgi:hypothetical protein